MQRRKPNRRHGNVLLLFALFAFAMFAVVGMALDLGFARLTQRQMQAGVDSAAREGMRFRDEIPQAYLNDAAFLAQVQPECGPMPGTPQTLTDPAWMLWRENVRRWLARNQVNLAYADGVDAATGNAIQYGAGPELQITGGVGDANAFQTITPPTAGDVVVYKPALQLNLSNDPVGDLVALNSGVNPNFPVGTIGDEADNYQQKNFTVADKTVAPQADSFLVRLRRTNDTHGNVRNPVDNQTGISTSGNALPLIFAQGSLVAGMDPTQGYSPRHDGITVRATAIAQGARAQSAGMPNPNSQIMLAGVTPFLLDKLALWDAPGFTATAGPVQATVDAAGNITVTTPGFGAGPHGRFVTPSVTALGQPASLAIPVSALQSFPITGYVPVYQAIVNGSGQPAVVRIVGFGQVTMTLVSGTPVSGAITVQLTKAPMQIAPENVSVTLSAPLNLLDNTELANLWTAFTTMAEPVLAPALVR